MTAGTNPDGTVLTPGRAGRYADGVYDRNAPGWRDTMEAYVSAGGFSSNEERLTQMALASQLGMDADEIRAIRPTFAKMPLFPPREGYTHRELTIEDVINVDRRYPDSSAQFSGSSGSFSSSSTPSMGYW